MPGNTGVSINEIIGIENRFAILKVEELSDTLQDLDNQNFSLSFPLYFYLFAAQGPSRFVRLKLLVPNNGGISLYRRSPCGG